MATDNNSANVSVGKPKVGGAVYWAPAGTTLPTDASTALPSAFLNVGFVSDSGVSIGASTESNSHKAWGGTEVANDVTGYSETTAFEMLEVSANAMKLAFGPDQVTASGESVTAVKHSIEAFLTESVLVVETLVNSSRIRRSVVGRAKLIERGEINYNDGDLVKYPVTFANLDNGGVTSVDYYAEVA